MLLRSKRIASSPSASLLDSSSSSTPSSIVTALQPSAELSPVNSSTDSTGTNSSKYHPIKSHSVSDDLSSPPHTPICHARRYTLAIETPASHLKHPNTPFSAWLVKSPLAANNPGADAPGSILPKQHSLSDLKEFESHSDSENDVDSPLSPINRNDNQRLSICSATSNDSSMFSATSEPDTTGSTASIDGWTSHSAAGAAASSGQHKHHRCNSTAIKFNTPRYY